MDTPPNSMGNDVSNRAMMLQGHRLKGPPTLSSMDYPEKQNLENDTPRGSDASQNRSTFDLARRNEGPATAVSHSRTNRGKKMLDFAENGVFTFYSVTACIS